MSGAFSHRLACTIAPLVWHLPGMVMISILAFETSGEHGRIALLRGDAVVERCIEQPPHSRTLLPETHALLAEHGVSLAQIDAIAFGSGPGAFTGVRLACGVAQGLAVGLDRPLLPVGTLAALASQHPVNDARVLVASDARMGELYVAAYQLCPDTEPVCLAEPACLSPQSWSLPAPGAWHAIGQGWQVHGERIPASVHAALVAPPCLVTVTAAAVARLAALAWARGGARAAEEVSPLYVRDKVAQTTAERLAQGGKA